jgi:hypothetical protein
MNKKPLTFNVVLNKVLKTLNISTTIKGKRFNENLKFDSFDEWQGFSFERKHFDAHLYHEKGEPITVSIYNVKGTGEKTVTQTDYWHDVNLTIQHKAIGYQIISNDGNNNIPDEFYSFEILSFKDANKWLKKNDKKNEWIKTPIYKGDIEEPTFIKL